MILRARAFHLLFVVACTMTAFLAAGGGSTAAAASKGYIISSIKPEMLGNALYMTITGDSQPTYIVTERYAPFRVLVDIADATLPMTGGAVTLPKNDFVTYTVSTVKDRQVAITRFDFKIAKSHAYKVVTEGNDIKIAITPSAGETAANTISEPPILTDIQVQRQSGVTTVKLVSTTPLADYKTSTRPGGKNKSAAMVIDIANVSVGKMASEKNVQSAALAKIRVAQRGNGARVVFDAVGPALFEFVVNRLDNGIQAIIKDEKPTAATKMVAAPPAIDDSTLGKFIESSRSLLPKSQRAGGAKDPFLASGYSSERISVDFYKIDIHNVFRLFREVSNLNVIVDESVKGTLTLTLNDIPWDFALDIICNLMELNQTGRDNTIVIYPKKKEFVWPSGSGGNLSVTADQRVINENALIIQQMESQPEHVVRARELMVKAAKAEKTGDFEQAAAMYEEAVSLNPKNAKNLDRLAALYLVNLRINAKALYYAKESLKVSPQNRKAALYAAIAAANMQQTREASDYFAQSISGNPPMKEALLSFAAFAENNRRYDLASLLLDKYRGQYGDSLDTMVAKARIFDKQNKKTQALAQYQAILSSGFAMPLELRRYAEERLAAGQ